MLRVCLGIPPAAAGCVCPGRSVGRPFKVVLPIRIAFQVLWIFKFGHSHCIGEHDFQKTNHISAGLQCVVSADLPYCTDIDECTDSRQGFNKADACGEHAVLFDPT